MLTTKQKGKVIQYQKKYGETQQMHYRITLIEIVNNYGDHQKVFN